MDTTKGNNVWQIASAKAAFSQIVSMTAEGPQIIKNREEPVAAIVSMADYQILQNAKRKWADFALYSQELAESDDFEIRIPPRELSSAQL